MNLRRVYKAVFAVGVAVVLVRLAQVARDLAIAKYFGISPESDAFFLAVLIPMHVVNVISGSISVALVPRVIKAEEERGEKAAHSLIESTAAMTLGLLVTVGLIVAIAFPLFAQSLGANSSEDASLTSNLIWILLPMLVLSGMSTLWSGILTAKEKFGLPSVVPAITPVVALITLGFWTNDSNRIYALAVSTSVGTAIELIILKFALRKRGYHLLPRWRGLDASVRSLTKDFSQMAVGATLITQVSLLPQFIAVGMGSGSVSVLSYATKVSTVFASIAGVALSTVTQTYFAQLVARSEWPNLQAAIRKISWLALGGLCLVSALTIWGSEFFTTLLFQRGEFTRSDTLKVSPVQAIFAIQIPWAALSLVYYRLAAALGASSLLWQLPLGGVCLLAALCFPLSKQWGVSGLAASVVAFHIVSTTLYWWFLTRKVIPRKVHNDSLDFAPQGGLA